jgi:hypothetical protein
MSDATPRDPTNAAVACAAVGAVGLALGLVVSPRQALYSYLGAFTYVATVTLGALVFLQIVLAMNATWPVAVRRVVEAIVGTMPLLALAFVPIALGLGTIYPWAHPGSIADEHVREAVRHKRAWLDGAGFVARAALYFALWIGTALWLRRDSAREDADAASAPGPRMRAVAAATLPGTGLTITFAAFDWWMSLTPAWASTMYGVYVFAGGFVSALALITLVAARATDAGRLPLGPSHFHALGRLLLAFVVFWAYAAFFQLFLVYMADKPDEAPYYAVRARTSWSALSVALGVACFVIPFAALLPYAPKRRRAYVAGVSVWLLAAHALDVHWLVMPAAFPVALHAHWLDVAAYLALGGAFVALGARLARGRAPLPVNDPSLPRALRYESR